MISDFYNCNTYVFDCDGVVLNSNRVKTIAFYETVLSYGEAFANQLLKYHVNNGGISRYAKFDYFLKHILPKDFFINESYEFHFYQLLSEYANLVYQGLLECEIAPELKKLREITPNSRWLIVSGGDEIELHKVFALRGLKDLFNGGIFGSPDSKDQILKREIINKNILHPAIFIGDSKYDYLAATKAGLDFIFLSEWSEVEGWREWSNFNNIIAYRDIHELLSID